MNLTLNNRLVERLGAINITLALAYFAASGQMVAALLILTISFGYLFSKPSVSFKLDSDTKFQIVSLLILFTFVFFSNSATENELPLDNLLTALIPTDISLTSLVNGVTWWVEKMITLL